MKYLDPSTIVKGRVIVCVGTRPSFVKMAPVIIKLEERGIDYRILHTGQHYSPDLANIYNEPEFHLRKPDHYIEGLQDCETHAEQTALIMTGAEKVFLEERPEVVLVCADANFNFACGVAARKLRLRLGHVESGLRCFDPRVPEEHNRRMLDHISDYLFAPTFQSVLNLARELVPGIIVHTGNTVCDALRLVMDRVINSPPPMNEPYILMTMHREENVDDPVSLKKLTNVVKSVHRKTRLPILFPVHPRTSKRLKEYGLTMKDYVKCVPPMPYIPFLAAMMNAVVVLTDSGGVQEETCALQVPCVVLRDSTERMESVEVGASIVTGLNPLQVTRAVQIMRSQPRGWVNPYDPFEDANAAERIVEMIGARFSR